MSNTPNARGRREFIKSSATLAYGFSVFPQFEAPHVSYADDEINIVGPKKGYSPQVGTMVSMMNWMRNAVLNSVKGMSKEELDYLHDEKSNSIGSMLLHLAATEKFYQLNTFEGRDYYNDSEKRQWETAMKLGDEARQSIKGNELDYYLNILKETRDQTLGEFKRRDDKWLMTVDPKFFSKLPTNNYCKWFHVCEHESNHNGQIKWIRSRLPGGKSEG